MEVFDFALYANLPHRPHVAHGLWVGKPWYSCTVAVQV